MRKEWSFRINRKLMKKVISISLAAALLVAGGLTGCSRKTDTAGESSAQETTAEASGEGITDTESDKEIPTTEAPIITPPSSEVSTIAPFPQVDPDATVMENIIIGTDIHYLSPSLTDGGDYFQKMVENGDGKVVTYIDEITDAFLDEVIELRPNALVLSGDLTLDGEKLSHEELAQKLYRVERAGIPVLAIPGNHDINNHRAARFEGNSRLPAEYTTPEEFREIYKDFGYDEAISEDKYSLSYVYQLDEQCRVLMLDSCQYRPMALVGGAILSDTYDWIEEQLIEAWEEDITVIPVAHHNLLEESEIYVDNCTIEHGEQLEEMLDEWDVRLFLSGHLHVQHAMESDEGNGIWEMVTSSLATPQCQYGSLTLYEDNSFYYRTFQLDVEGWAQKNGSTNSELLSFNKFEEPFLRQVFYNQAIAELKEIGEIPQAQKLSMARIYEELNYYYYQGTAYTIADSVKTNPDYLLWDEYSGLTELSDYVQYIVRDAVTDYNRVEQ